MFFTQATFTEGPPCQISHSQAVLCFWQSFRHEAPGCPLSLNGSMHAEARMSTGKTFSSNTYPDLLFLAFWDFLAFLNFGLWSEKILVSVKILVRNSGAGNGCANFMGAWKNAFFLQEKPMSVKFLLLGGGGECRFYFYGREDFSDLKEFPIFSRDFRRSEGIENLCLFGGFSLHFLKNKEDQGNSRIRDPQKGPENRCRAKSVEIYFWRFLPCAKNVEKYFWRFFNFPDPPTLAFLRKKSKGNHQRSKGFSLRGTPKILGKREEKRTKKQGKLENEKSKEIEKSKDWRVRVFCHARNMSKSVENIFWHFLTFFDVGLSTGPFVVHWKKNKTPGQPAS